MRESLIRLDYNYMKCFLFTQFNHQNLFFLLGEKGALHLSDDFGLTGITKSVLNMIWKSRFLKMFSASSKTQYCTMSSSFLSNYFLLIFINVNMMNKILCVL